MSDDSDEHQIFRDLKMLNGLPDDMPQPKIINQEATKLVFMDPQQRAIHIRDVENRVMSYDKTSNLRSQVQGRRLVQSLKATHEKIKAAGR
jgi:hypothetical protein